MILPRDAKLIGGRGLSSVSLLSEGGDRGVSSITTQSSQYGGKITRILHFCNTEVHSQTPHPLAGGVTYNLPSRFAGGD